MQMLSYNRFFKEMNFSLPSQIEGYIDIIKNRYRINMNFHDLSGVSSITPALEKVFAPYLYHNNSFCNYVKKHENTFKECTSRKDTLCAFSKKRLTPFYGRCYMGVEEFVFPVLCEGNLIALICIGQFTRNIARSLRNIRKMAQKSGIDPEEAGERYLDIAKEVDFSVKELSYDLGILCQLISSIYLNFINQGTFKTENKNQVNQAIQNQKSNFIINNTIRFIYENYNKELSLKTLASNSYCNSSYLSHIFKEKMDISVTDYINRVRIDAAKQLLDTTSKSVTEVCMLVGYNDSGYFSRVFKQYTGVCPSSYRERMT